MRESGDDLCKDHGRGESAKEIAPVQAPEAPVLGKSVAVGPRAGAARLASTATKKPGRRLWARDRHGKFRTHGNDSVASVRGTHWLTEDTCAGTRTRVTEGSVAVRDLHRKRTVVVRAGHSYLARRSG